MCHLSRVVSAVKKFASSSIGKILLIGAAIYTGGVALSAYGLLLFYDRFFYSFYPYHVYYFLEYQEKDVQDLHR